MLKIYSTDKETFQAKSASNDAGAVLIADPSQFISNFFLSSLDKFSIIPVPQEAKKIISDKNIHKYKVEEFFKPALINSITRQRYNNLERIFEKGLLALENCQNVYATPNGAVLFIEWLYNKKIKVEKCENDLLIDEMIETYNKIKNESFYPIALERLLKLFMLFYNKQLNKDSVFKISNFQKKLIDIENSEKEIGIELLNNDLLIETQEIKEIIITLQEKDTNEIPSINIYNKCIEELISLENKITSDTKKIFKENFVKINSNNNFEDKFLEMYQEVLY